MLNSEGGVNLKIGSAVSSKNVFLEIDIPIEKKGCEHENWGCIQYMNYSSPKL